MKCSQNRAILAYLKKGKKLTPLDSLNRFGTFRLSARIFDLREQGHKIESRLVWKGKKHVAEYRLSSPIVGAHKV